MLAPTSGTFYDSQVLAQMQQILPSAWLPTTSVHKMMAPSATVCLTAVLILKSLSKLTSLASARLRGGGRGDRTFPLGALAGVVFVVNLTRRCGLGRPAYDETRQQKESPAAAVNMGTEVTSAVSHRRKEWVPRRVGQDAGVSMSRKSISCQRWQPHVKRPSRMRLKVQVHKKTRLR